MNTYLEDLIRDAQRRQAGRAVPPERILARLPLSEAPRTRTRPRGMLLVAAFCTLGLAVVAVPVTVRVGTAAEPPAVQEGGARAVAVWSGTVPDFATLRSPLWVWPEAVHRIPEKLPGGDRYTVSVVLGAGRYLVRSEYATATSTGNDLAEWPVVLDSAAGTARPLSGPPARPSGGELSEVFVVGDRALWGLRRGADAYELWGAPLDGSVPASLLTTWPLPGEAYPIGVDAGLLYWRYLGGGPAGGVYRMSLEGFVLEKVGGTEDFQDFGAFPWVSSRPPTGVDTAGRRQRAGVLLNVVTGERRSWKAYDETGAIACDPLLCVGFDSHGRATVQRLDGSDRRRLPYRQRAVPYERTAFAGRFGIGSFTETGDQTWIWDRVTGAAATVPRLALSAERMPLRAVQWQERDGARYVLDLAAVAGTA